MFEAEIPDGAGDGIHPYQERRPGHRGLILLAVLLLGLASGGAAGGILGYTLGERQSPPRQSLTVQGHLAGPEADAVVHQVNPAVVTVESREQVSRPGASGNQVAGTGSGFVFDAAGHIVTNEHVVEGADALTVVFSDGRRVDARLVGSDVYQDIAVVQVDGPVPAVAQLGDSDQLQPGEPVIAIGSALGEFPNTVTEGLVSARGRSLDTGDGYRLEHLVQHDAAINPGNSGGPLVDMHGEIVGMNTAVVTGDESEPAAGLGFAIESNTVRDFAQQLITQGRIPRPYIGLTVQAGLTNGAPNDESDTEPVPVVVRQVDPGSPAETAGLTLGDRITALNGRTLDAQHQFFNLLFAHKPGDTLTLTVRRRGQSQERSVSVTLTDGSSTKSQ